MKKLFLFITLAAISTLSFAQPSQATMKSKISSLHSGPNFISVELLGNGLTDKEYEDGAWHYYYRHSYRTKSKTEYDGIYYIYSGSIQYEKAGAYQYDQLLIGDSWYEGVPDPDKNEIIEMLNTDLKEFLKTFHYNKIVGEVSEISFPTDPEWHWSKLTNVEFLVNVTYSESISYTKLEKAQHSYKVTMISDEFKGPWVRFMSQSDKKNKSVISVTEYTSEEIDAMKTLADLDAENSANNFLANLPEVGEIPTFKSDKQLFYFMHEIVMGETTKNLEAYVYKAMDKSCYKENSEVLLNHWAVKWYDYLIENHEAYKGAHCMYPTVKAHQKGMITFYDKEDRRMLTMSATQSGDTWMLTDISFYAASSSEIESMKSLDGNCGEKPDLTVREVLSYKVGDRVLGKFTEGWYAGTIDKLDPYNKNRYHILYDDGDQNWMDEVNIKQGSVAAVTEETTEETTEEIKEETKTNVTFKVGDKVLVNTTSGKKKGKITKYASHKYLVKFTDPRLGDTWCKPGNLEHQ